MNPGDNGFIEQVPPVGLFERFGLVELVALLTFTILLGLFNFIGLCKPILP